jgi:hypothetical protein
LCSYLLIVFVFLQDENVVARFLYLPHWRIEVGVSPHMLIMWCYGIDIVFIGDVVYLDLFQQGHRFLVLLNEKVIVLFVLGRVQCDGRRVPEVVLPSFLIIYLDCIVFVWPQIEELVVLGVAVEDDPGALGVRETELLEMVVFMQPFMHWPNVLELFARRR